jgi:hypothetical protein
MQVNPAALMRCASIALHPPCRENRLTFLSNVVAYACRHLAQEDRYSAHASDVCFEIGAGSPPKAWGILLPF